VAAPTVEAPSRPEPNRAAISERTLRQDRWWLQPVISGAVLFAFIVYSTWAALQNSNYYADHLLSPFYSPCVASVCEHARAGNHILHATSVGIVGTWWPITPAILVLIFPLGFRMTCYYYRRSYYRAFWQSPPACAVAEPHRRYTGETRFPLIMQNVHRYFFYAGILLNMILTYDAVEAFRSISNPQGTWGHAGFGTLMLVINAILLWLYSVSCHSCRHIVGGRLRHFSKHPVRYWTWGVVSKLNQRHMQFAWISLVWVGLTDLYVRLVASGWVADPRFF
jgi:hypothetical protein